MWLNDLIAIMNNIDDSASSLKYTSFDLRFCYASPFAYQFHIPGFHGFLDKVYDFIWYFVHFKAVYHIYPTPPLGQDMTQGQFFKRSLTGLKSEFSFS